MTTQRGQRRPGGRTEGWVPSSRQNPNGPSAPARSLGAQAAPPPRWPGRQPPPPPAGFPRAEPGTSPGRRRGRSPRPPLVQDSPPHFISGPGGPLGKRKSASLSYNPVFGRSRRPLTIAKQLTRPCTSRQTLYYRPANPPAGIRWRGRRAACPHLSASVRLTCSPMTMSKRQPHTSWSTEERACKNLNTSSKWAAGRSQFLNDRCLGALPPRPRGSDDRLAISAPQGRPSECGSGWACAAASDACTRRHPSRSSGMPAEAGGGTGRTTRSGQKRKVKKHP